MTHPPALSASDVSFTYGDLPALRNLTFTVSTGEYIGIIGPNGGGKTTLLNIILGLLVPDAGTMTVFGMDPKEARQERLIGYVPQRAGQNARRFPATVEEVVRSGLAAFPRSQQTAERVHGALQDADVLDLRHRLLHELSGGQCQRVLIARALVSSPKLLILDEPATGVDTLSKEQFYNLLTSLHRERGMTILFVTHDIAAIASDVDRVLCVNRTLCIHNSPKDFLEKHFLAGFLEHHV